MGVFFFSGRQTAQLGVREPYSCLLKIRSRFGGKLQPKPVNVQQICIQYAWEGEGVGDELGFCIISLHKPFNVRSEKQGWFPSWSRRGGAKRRGGRSHTIVVD